MRSLILGCILVIVLSPAIILGIACGAVVAAFMGGWLWSNEVIIKLGLS